MWNKETHCQERGHNKEHRGNSENKYLQNDEGGGNRWEH